MAKDKIVCFAGPRYDWKILGVRERLEKTIIELINKGYTIFYDGNKGAFDNLCTKIVINLKRTYKNIKIIKILTDYKHEKEKWEPPSVFDESIYPNLENCYPKARIIKRNEWMIDHCDILVCHIYETYKSGAYKMLKYAQKINKPYLLI